MMRGTQPRNCQMQHRRKGVSVENLNDASENVDKEPKVDVDGGKEAGTAETCHAQRGTSTKIVYR